MPPVVPRPPVVVCYAKPETGPKALFHDALVQLLLCDRDATRPRILDVFSLTSSPRIAATRNALVTAFLADPREPEWLLMLDDDMVFRPDLVERLLEAADPDDRPLVAGLYFGGKLHGPQTPHIYVLNDNGVAFDPVEGVKGGWGPVVRIHGAGAGCLLMHRRALQRIGGAFEHTGFPWFAEASANGQDYGEDLVFCLRAYSLDIPLWCHTGAILGHVKPGIVDEQTYEQYKARRDEVGEEKVVAEYRERIRLPAAQDVPRWQTEPTPTLPPEPFVLPPDELAVPIGAPT